MELYHGFIVSESAQGKMCRVPDTWGRTTTYIMGFLQESHSGGTWKW